MGNFRKAEVDYLYDKMRLTTSKVLKMIRINEMSLSKPQSLFFWSCVVPVMVVSISFLNFGRKKSGFLDPKGTVHSLYTLNQQVNSHNEIVFA